MLTRAFFSALVLAGCVSAQSQPIPASGPHQGDTAGAKDKASGPYPLSARAEAPLAPPQAQATQQHAKCGEREGSNPCGLFERWWEKFQDDPLVLFTFVLAVSTVLLWIDTNRLRRAAQGQATDTKTALGIARDAANTSSDTVKTMQDTARRELRAYVALEEIGRRAGDWIVRIRIQNYGATPARELAIIANVQRQAPSESSWRGVSAVVVGGQMLHPRQKSESEYGFQLPAEYTPGETLFAFGRIIYQDIYGRWWATRFCYEVGSDEMFKIHYGNNNKEEGPCQSRDEFGREPWLS